MVTLIVFTISIDASPIPITSGKASSGLRTNPSPSSSARNTAPPPRMRPRIGRWLVAKARISEPRSEPAPRAANSAPYPPELISSVSRVKIGSSVWKFIASPAMPPSRTNGQSTVGVAIA
jgi:hypothetical protein